MKDIRNFFGSTSSSVVVKKKEEAKVEVSPKVTTQTSNKVKAQVTDELMIDSDDEFSAGNKPERKRLKSCKAVSSSPEPVQSVVKTPVSGTLLADTKGTDCNAKVMDLIESSENLVDLTCSPVRTPVTTAAIQDLLPTLKPLYASSASTKKSVANVKQEVVDASSFFGGSPSAPVKPTAIKSTPLALVKKEAPHVASSYVSTESKKVKLEAVSSSVAASPNKKAKTSTSTPICSSSLSSVAAPKMPLEDLKIAVTGVMESGLSREQMEDLVLTHGGKVSKSVSGKTDYLVVGSVLEDGRAIEEGNKHRLAEEKHVRIITEDVLMEMIAAGTVRREAALVAQSAATPSKPIATTVFVKQPSLQHSSAQSKSSSSSSSSSGNYSGGAGLLWVDKHQPQNTSELVGSGELVKKMSDWLRRWDAVHLTKTMKVPFAKDNPGAKAILLSGPPGIGKTTVATLIAKEFNYDVLELNASDTRNKRDVGDHLSDAVLSRAISADGSTSLRRRLVIMDEVDGMGGSDRGGVAELIRIIKLSKTPIVCICNDRMSTKIRSLANHCYDLKVKRPTKQQIAARLVMIAQKEGMTVDTNAAEMLVEQVGNDIRQAVNSMQMWRASSDRMQYADMKDSMHRIEKDKVLRQTSFDACMQILGGSKNGSLEDRYNSFFIDYSLVPLLVQQNYVDSAKSGVFKSPNLDEGDKMEALSRASDAVSDVDLVGACIMGQDQHWELLPAQAAFSTRVGSIIHGFQAFPSFPAWLGKNSTRGKFSRLTKEIVSHSALSIGQGFCPIRLDYVPYLRSTLLGLLAQGGESGTEGVTQVIDLLDSYGLNRDDFMETLREMQFLVENDRQFTDRYESIETRVKSALTRAYNSGNHRSQVLVSEIASKGAKKGRGGGGGGGDGGGGGGFDEEGMPMDEDMGAVAEEEDVEETEEESIAAFVAKSKKTAAQVKASQKMAKSATAKTKAPSKAKK